MTMQADPRTTLLPELSGPTALDRLSRLYDIVRSLNSLVSLDNLLDQIVASAAELMEARGAALLLLQPDGRHLRFEVTSGRVSSRLKGMVVSMNGRSVVGRVATTGMPYVENRPRHGDNTAALQITDDDSYTPGKLICVPLRAHGKISGVVTVLDKVSGEDFAHDDLKLLEAMASAAAVAIGNVQLYEGEKQKAEELMQAYEELSKTYRATLQALTGLLDARDTLTHGHSSRVVAFTMRLAEALHITDPDRLRSLEQGALLHDVGKIGVPDAILRKPGPLTDEEWKHMRSHPEVGYRLLKDMEFLRDALPIVRYHHEHWDGGGYPHGLKGEEIPLEARIFAVADAFDAITSERPYSAPRTYEQAVEIIRSESGKTFDPTVVEAFLAVTKEEWQRIRRKAANLTGPL